MVNNAKRKARRLKSAAAAAAASQAFPCPSPPEPFPLPPSPPSEPPTSNQPQTRVKNKTNPSRHQKQRPPRANHSPRKLSPPTTREKTVEEEAIRMFNENVANNLTPSGALDLEGFINAGMDASDHNKIITLVHPDCKRNGKQCCNDIPRTVGIEPKAPLPGSSRTNYGDGEDDFADLFEELNLTPVNRLPSLGETPLQYISLVNRSHFENRDPYEATRNLQDPFATVTVSARFTESPKQNNGMTNPPVPVVPISEDAKRGQNRKRIKTILKISKEEVPAPTSATILPTRETTDHDKTMQAYREFRRITHLTCLNEGCIKPATVPCLTCKLLLYCTDRHRKISRKLHELECNAYREIETKAMGKHMIAARDIKRTHPVITDEPVIVLPLNPSLESRTFPATYCVKCFRNSVPPLKTNTSLCPSGCQLQVCNTPVCHPIFSKTTNCNPREVIRVPPHGEFECKVLSCALLQREIGKKYVLITDQSVLGMIRCIGYLTTNPLKLTKEFRDLINTISPQPYTKNFQSKLMLIRELLQIDPGIITNDQLYKIDQAVLRFGRNIGPDIVTFRETQTLVSVYTRCIYPKLAYVVHSCVPNTILTVSTHLAAATYAVKEIKKGDVLSICYDERCLFMPTRSRHRFLLSEFGYDCKCKRCTSPSELQTYYSSFPCSRCPKGQGYLVPDNPLDEYSTWMCNKCKKTPVYYLRIIDTTFNLKGELEGSIKKNDPLRLLALMVELVNENLLHWNHHLIFNASVKLFSILWNALNKNDMRVMGAYSKNQGLQFIKPAETLINVTQAFMPDGYAHSFVLPLRLSCVIRLRSLTSQLEQRETTLDKVNSAVAAMYFRAFDISKIPLYELHVNLNTPIPSSEDRNLKVMEMRVVTDLVENVLIPRYGVAYSMKAKEIEKLYRARKKDVQLLELSTGKEDNQRFGIFPWDMQV